MSKRERVLVGYDECQCILTQYCDGECRPVFADRPSRYGSADRDTAPGSALNCALAEIDRLNAIVNTPHADDFVQAMSIEAEHQRQRWGAEGDAGKTPADWFWLVGYLAGKALHSHAAGNVEKAEHHIITTAAACANWHRNMFGKTDMRPGHQEGTGLIAASAPKEPT